MDIELGQSNPTPGWSWFTTKMPNFTDDDTCNAKYNSETNMSLYWCCSM